MKKKQTDCELVNDTFKVVSESSNYDDTGTLFCRSGQMFYDGSPVSNITARCDESATWSFDSEKVRCYTGFRIYFF